MKTLKNAKGITLIALVVTIVVLMILSGIVVAALMGNNGLITRAGDAKENQRAAAVQDEVTLALSENRVTDEINKTKGVTDGLKTKTQIVEDLETKKYLRPDEADKLLGRNGETEQDTITIGSITIVFSQFVSEPKWVYNHITQTVTKGTLTLKIGDRVNDSATQTITGFDGKWRVLGAENGKLLLVTNTCWAPFEGAATPFGASYPSLKLEGLAGWNNGVANLNAVGEAYANSSSKFEDGRSIKIEDVDRITGYNPNNTGVNDPDKTGTGTPYGNGTISQYGNKATYTIKAGVTNSGNRVWYKGDKGQLTETESTYQTFKPLGETNNITEPYTVESDHYFYYATTLTETNDNSASVGLANNSPAYDMLFNVQGPPYWLASPCIRAYEDGFVDWGFRDVNNASVSNGGVWISSSGSTINIAFGVRPVVYLKSDVVLTPGTTDAQGITTYTI